MALVLPIFIVFLLMAVDFGRVFFSYIQITNAAREAAAYGASVPTDGTGIVARANAEKNVQSQGGESALSVSYVCLDSAGNGIDCSDAAAGSGPGNTLEVTIAEPFTFLTPLVGDLVGAITLDVSATSSILGYATGEAGLPPASCTPPSPSFAVIVTADLSVRVDPSASTPNDGVCNISGYLWKWGDLSEDTVGSPTGNDHTYASPGTYPISLVVTNQGGSLQSAPVDVTVPATAPIVCDAPEASFTITPNGNVYTYRDTSTVTDPECPITAWLWTFADGTQSNARFPIPVDYGDAGGPHVVTLEATNLGGTDSAP